LSNAGFMPLDFAGFENGVAGRFSKQISNILEIHAI